jgi:RNA polymerase sigma factor (sigma-70 family)
VIPREGGDDELDVVASFVDGDAQALREVYARWAPLVYRLAFRTLDNRQDAEDVTQAVFISAWQHRSGFDATRGELGGWIVGIARHRIADAMGQRGRTARLQAALEADAAARDADGRSDVGQTAMIREELTHLKETPRRIVELAYYSDLSHSQIAEELGIPLGTVKSHIRRSVETMRIDWEVDDGSP